MQIQIDAENLLTMLEERVTKTLSE